MSEELKAVNNDIKGKIRKFIVNNYLLTAETQDISDTDSFLDRGIVDSTGILELVEFIQDTFGIEIKDEELIPQNLDSLANLEVFIKSKTNKR